VTGQWFSPGTPVSCTNKTDCHDITEILLKVALNTKNKQILAAMLNFHMEQKSCMMLIEDHPSNISIKFDSKWASGL